jgi:hypothetical protein
MKVRLPVLLVAPLLCCAGETCPWISSGTVGGILGDPVDSKVTANTCEFTHRSGKMVGSLRVEVEPIPRHAYQKYLAECKSKPEPLKAIGNEAVTCHTGAAELAIGRVRDRVFVIRVNASHGAEKARTAAEHVAGNLF